jgi:stress-induced morphogen
MTGNGPVWETKRTPETQSIETLLREYFQHVDSYRYNSASIRVRVVDARFEGISREMRDAMVEPYLERLPSETQRDIVALFTFAPSELRGTPEKSRSFLQSVEFDKPSPSTL